MERVMVVVTFKSGKSYIRNCYMQNFVNLSNIEYRTKYYPDLVNITLI